MHCRGLALANFWWNHRRNVIWRSRRSFVFCQVNMVRSLSVHANFGTKGWTVSVHDDFGTYEINFCTRTRLRQQCALCQIILTTCYIIFGHAHLDSRTDAERFEPNSVLWAVHAIQPRSLTTVGSSINDVTLEGEEGGPN